MPPSKATYREVDGATIVYLNGTFMCGESSAVLRKAILDLTGKWKSKIILNFRDVTSIDSAGVGELLVAYTAANNPGGRLKVLNPPKKISDMLALTQLSNVFEVYPVESKHFRASRGD